MREKQFMKFLINLFFMTITFSSYGNRIPSNNSGIEFKSTTIIQTKISKSLIFSTELEHMNRLEKRKTQSFLFNFKFRLNKHFTLIANIERKYGERFDEDWVVSNGTWFWGQNNNRGVNWLYVGAGYKSKWSFLPGTNWKFDITGLYKHNFHNEQKTFLLSPSLSYLYFSDGKRKNTFFLKNDIFYGLNFAKNNIYRMYNYLGVLWHPAKNIAIGGFVGRSFYSWFSIESFEKKFNESYEVTNKSTIVGLILSTRF